MKCSQFVAWNCLEALSPSFTRVFVRLSCVTSVQWQKTHKILVYNSNGVGCAKMNPFNYTNEFVFLLRRRSFFFHFKELVVWCSNFMHFQARIINVVGSGTLRPEWILNRLLSSVQCQLGAIKMFNQMKYVTKARPKL